MQTTTKFGPQYRINDPKVKTASAINIICFLPNLSEFGPIIKNFSITLIFKFRPVIIDPSIPPITATDTTI